MLDQVKEFLDIKEDDTTKDSKLKIYISTAEKMIISYLNNDGIDKDYVEENFGEAVVLMVSNAYEYQKANINRNVKSETQGDRSRTYIDGNTAFAITDDIKTLLPVPYIKTFY
ncbi:MAG: phage head-tail connector protein [Clostridium butyricum]|nr:phage head-tail connector protein [Clostridium butyricum]